MKMKFILAICVLLITSGCINREVKDVFVKPIETTNEIKFLFTPGTYRGEADGYGGRIVVSVTVTDSQITAIEILEQREVNFFVDENGNVIGEENGDETEMPGDETGDESETTTTDNPELEGSEIDVFGVMDGIISVILAEQKTNIDFYTEATVTRRGLIEAIQRALTEASL